jgi:feruloyl esterase
MAKLNDATDPDIRPFIGHGGKLIVWQGGADAALSVNSTIEYMKQMRQAVGAKNADHSTRLYIAPGVNHCEGGVGPDHTDLLSALDHWISRGAEPGTLMAQKLDGSGKVLRSLPLCQYPQYPRYTGRKHDAAAIKSSSNYVCANP